MTDEETINECHREIRRLRSVVRQLEDEIQEAEKPENKAKQFLSLLLDMLATQPRSSDVKDNPGFWTDGESILCSSETECEIVADFIEDVLHEFSTAVIATGCYDEKEDKASGTVDGHTGFHYISIT